MAEVRRVRLLDYALLAVRPSHLKHGGDRHFDFDAAKRDEVLLAHVVQNEQPVGPAHECLDVSRLGVDEHMHLERSQPPVERELLAAVAGFGRRRQHFDDQGR